MRSAEQMPAPYLSHNAPEESKGRRRRSNSTKWASFAQLVILILVVCIVMFLIYEADGANQVDPSAAGKDNSEKRYDCVIVPGGGLGSDALPLPWVAARLDSALAHEAETNFFLVLSRGTTHKPPPLDSAGFPVDESAASARYLVEKGHIATSRVLLESWSLDTIGNAAFARLMHSDVRGWRRLLIVTSSSHMPRTRKIFEWIFSLPPGPDASGPGKRVRGRRRGVESSVQSSRPAPPQLEFEEVDDEDHLEATHLMERRKKEADALAKLEATTTKSITDLVMLHEFLFAHHDAYRALTAEDADKRARERAKGALAASY